MEKAIWKFDERRKETENENVKIRLANEEAEKTKARKDREFEAWKRSTFNPQVDILEKIVSRISNCEEKGVSRFFSDTVTLHYTNYFDSDVARNSHGPCTIYESHLYKIHSYSYTRVVDAAIGRSLQAEYNKQSTIVDKLKERTSDFYYFKRPTPYLGTNDVVSMTVGGSRVKVSLNSIDRGNLVSLIGDHKKKKDEQEKKIRHIKARAADKETAVRGIAKQYKNDFDKQKRLVDNCPYCGETINQSDAQLDHIYPVSKGGISTEENLIFVCSSCNRKKSNDTIRAFIEGAGFNSDIIYGRLKKLNKDF